VYVAFKPPKGAQKCKMTVFRIKVDFSGIKSAKKFLYNLNLIFSSNVVRHSLAYLTVHKWLVRDVLLYLKFWAKMTHSLPNGDFQLIFDHSASAITPSENKFNYHL